MAVLARATITLAQTIDIESVTWYYKLQASTASAPAKPTTEVPSGWSTSEPSYTEGSTNSLYVVEKTTYSNGTFEYSDVSLSSSYEAAKTAYNKSVAVQSELKESRAWYAICSTDAAEVAKTATVSPATNDFSLREGMLLLVKFTKTNSGAVGNLTLNVNGTGPKNIKYIYNGSLSNIPGANYLKEGQTYQFYYDGTNWVVQMIYNTNTNTVGVYGGTVVAGQNGIRGYSLVMKDTDDTWVSITTDAGAGAKDAGNGTNHVKYAGGLRPDAVMYEGTQANYAEGATTGTCYLALGLNLRYSTNCGTSLIKGQDVYLVGTIGSDGLFYLDDTWWTQTIPTTEDGKTYIHLGLAYSTYQIYLAAENPIYQFYEGSFRLLSEIKAMEASKVATKYVTDQTDGIFVHPEGEGPNDTNTPTGWRIRDALEMLKSGVSLFKAWVENNVTKVRVGRDDKAHFLIQDGKIAGYGSASSIYFETGDGGNTVQQTYSGNGSTQYFNVLQATSLTSVTVNGTTVSATLENSSLVKLTSIPSDGATVVITYKTSVSAPYFTFGTRGSGTVGIGSSAFGNMNKAPGIYAMAEGDGSTASGFAAHAEGSENIAFGSHSHAEGRECSAIGDDSHAGGNLSEARGPFSFAHGLYAKATMRGSAAFGRYNFYNGALFSVGNGTGDSNRHNAFTVGETGNCFVAGKLISGSPGDQNAMFLVKEFSEDNLTVSGGGNIGTRTPSIAVAGYTPIAVATHQIMNATSGGQNANYCYLYACTLNGNVLAYNGRNTGSSTAKIKTIFKVFYIATAAIDGAQ